MTVRLICYVLLTTLTLSAPARGEAEFTEFLIDSLTFGTASVQGCFIDEDIHMDIAGAVIEDNDVVWWRSDGADPPNWTKHTIDTYLSGARSIYTEDINDDGRTDVVAASYTGRRVAWYRNEGGDPVEWTRFWVNTSYYHDPHEVCVDDLNLDGYMDVLATSSSQHDVAVWFGDGQDPPNWTKQTVRTNFRMGKSVRSGDIDGDGLPDIVGAALQDNDVMWFRNDGGDPIVWEPGLIDGDFYGVHRVQAVDMDNDLDLDVVGAAYLGNMVAWWENVDGAGGDWTRHNVGYGVNKACVAAGALLDDDEIMDIAATGQQSDEVSVWYRESLTAHTWTKREVDGSFDRVWPLDICDLNGDGREDIIAASGHTGCNRVKWYRNEPTTAISGEVPELRGELHVIPNPFNPQTSINFTLNGAGHVSLAVFDSRGREVAHLLEEHLPAGRHSVTFAGDDLASGVYHVRLNSTADRLACRLVLLK
ncbi:MAG: T9SS type A sorting domain-containing protein [bacterium]|nr:T9SS type A sorting domain-containing protein [bacterium]